MPSTIYVSYSELDAYRQCPLKWALSYQQRWSKPQVEGSPLSRGTDWHAILQVHYETILRERVSTTRFHLDGSPVFLENPSRGRTQEILWACQQAVAPLLVDTATGERTEQQELLGWMYEGYLQCYGIDESWQVLAVEQPGAAWLRTPTGARSRFVLRYKTDLRIRDLEVGQVKLVDHKSKKDFTRQMEIDIDDQFGLYAWADGRRGEKIAAVIRSDARTQRNKSPMTLDQRFDRKQTHRSAKELENIALDAYRAARAAYSRDAIFSSPNPAQCTWKCDFLEPHIALRKGLARPEVVLRDFGFRQRETKHPQYDTEAGTERPV